MVGVCFWLVSIILLVNSTSFAKTKDCPKVCRCLGNYIDCTSKKFETIPTNIPKWATHLNLHNNSIKKLNDVEWKNLSELTELRLNKNNITHIPNGAFDHQKHLKILEINRNRIRSIDALTFKSLGHLTILKLKKNQINQLKDGAFYGLLKIDKLILDYNNVQVISKGWLYGLNTLTELYLSHNNINRIEPDAWEFCPKLTCLDLSSNKLTSIEQDTFKNLGDLQKLILSNNSITNIQDDAFKPLPKLKSLNISYNKISWVIEDGNGVFKGLNDLIKLHLSGNNIKSINKYAFIGLKNVTHLSLANNNITSIQKYAFSEMSLLKELDINTTSLLCDCNLQWFIEWRNTTKPFKIHAICAYPEWLRGQSLFEIPTSNLTCDDLPKPRLTETSESEIMALKGENISLICKAMSSSNSEMIFQWKKDNLELSNADVIIKSRTDPDGKTTETSSQLNLRWVKHSDAGKYQCVVSNSYGKTYSQKSTISVLVYPTFVKKPKNVTVQAGDTAKLDCAASGEPQPEIAWHKDGGNNFPAASERRMHVMPTDDVFFIINAKPIDMGVYSCTAHNAAGIIKANATLTVQEKPYFVKSMEDKEVSEGELVVVQCMAKGVPKPTITWLKDGQQIVPTERHFFTAEDQLVIIVDTIETDSGLYECHLNNSLGEETGRSRILVKPNSIDTSNMLGVIIITVVCCAVLTSIIWFVIIIQTRRRGAIQRRQSELQEMPEMTDKSLQDMCYRTSDNVSDHSSWSCKDSGTGDSAKRSSDDLAPEEFTMIVNGETTTDVNNSHIPLLQYPLSTNHDRAVDIEIEPKIEHTTPPKNV